MEDVDAIRALVDAGKADSVAGFVRSAVSAHLDDVAGWGAMLAQALAESGGALSDGKGEGAGEGLADTSG